MNKIINDFENILKKNNLVNNIPNNIQKYALSTKKKNLKVILKKAKNYSLFFSLVLAIYYLLKTFGIKLSFLYAKIILAVTTVTVTVSAVTGTYITAKKYYPKLFEKDVIENNLKENNRIDNKEDKVEQILDKNILNEKITGDTKFKSISSTVKNEVADEVVKKDKINKKENDGTKYTIGVKLFTGINNEEITEKIKNSLIKELGSKKVTLLKNVERNQVAKIVMGSVQKLGSTQYITVRVVNVENFKVDYVISEKIKAEDNIDEKCFSISKKIINRLK